MLSVQGRIHDGSKRLRRRDSRSGCSVLESQLLICVGAVIAIRTLGSAAKVAISFTFIVKREVARAFEGIGWSWRGATRAVLGANQSTLE
jgi:hypothetical protein